MPRRNCRYAIRRGLPAGAIDAMLRLIGGVSTARSAADQKFSKKLNKPLDNAGSCPYFGQTEGSEGIRFVAYALLQPGARRRPVVAPVVRAACDQSARRIAHARERNIA